MYPHHPHRRLESLVELFVKHRYSVSRFFQRKIETKLSNDAWKITLWRLFDVSSSNRIGRFRFNTMVEKEVTNKWKEKFERSKRRSTGSSPEPQICILPHKAGIHKFRLFRHSADLSTRPGTRSRPRLFVMEKTYSQFGDDQVPFQLDFSHLTAV
jgi:hypothetical protein